MFSCRISQRRIKNGYPFTSSQSVRSEIGVEAHCAVGESRRVDGDAHRGEQVRGYDGLSGDQRGDLVVLQGRTARETARCGHLHPQHRPSRRASDQFSGGHGPQERHQHAFGLQRGDRKQRARCLDEPAVQGGLGRGTSR